jgi:HNH endonuclease
LGVINGFDLSKYYISLDGRNFVGQKRRVKKILSKRYETVSLTDTKGREYPFLVHKIIDVVLNGGNYNSVVDHKDGNKKNNNKENLEGITTRENTIRALGKSVRRIDIKTGEVVVFKSVSLALEALGKRIEQTQGISGVCNGKYGYKTAFGYKWKWDSIVSPIKENSNKPTKPRKPNVKRSVRRIDTKTGEVMVFKSISTALEALGKNTRQTNGISGVCDKKCGFKTSFGYRWEWI